MTTTQESFSERVAREKTEWNARADSIAKAIGPQWRRWTDEGDNGYSPSGYAVLTDGTARLTLREGKRLEVSAYFDESKLKLHEALRHEQGHRRNGPGSITLDKSRPVEILAREINRRLVALIPAWIESLQAVKATLDAERSTLASAVREALAVARGASESACDEGAIWHPHATGVRAWNGTEGVRWRIELRSIPHSLALRILALLNELES